MKFELRYGRSKTVVAVPDHLEILTIVPADLPKAESGQEMVQYAIEHPLGTPPLQNLLSSQSKLCVVLPDKTRDARTDLILPVLLKAIRAAGVPSKQVKFLFANGSHAGMADREKEAILGSEIAETYAFEEHDCSQSALKYVGTTPRGIPVRVNRLVTDSDFVIVAGTVVHHYFAGFGGGPKMIVPGVAACDTITQNHKMAVLSENSVLHPNCRPGHVKGNPVYEDIEDAFQMVNIGFSVQVVLDYNHEIQAAFAGDTLLAHKKCRRIIEKMNRVPIPQTFDCVIVSAGGFPKDVNLIQAHKAIYNAFQAVKPGGCMIVLAKCDDGIGSRTFLQWFDYSGLAEMKRAVMENYALNGNTALSLKEKLNQSTMYLISDLDKSISRRIGFVPVSSFEEAWAQASRDFNMNSVAVLPFGDVTLPELRAE
ncbi:MAG: nickel-dependent lactate racemase [Calditrichaeota bacterium]|nr:nickel-dependent lactate racemase [Calditrichota bacterium]